MTGDRLAELLKELGLTYQEFADKTGITKGQVANIISGKRELSQTLALAAEKEFNVSALWLQTGEGEKYAKIKQDLAEVARIAKQGRDLDLVPELRDLLPEIKKLKEEDYNVLVTTIKRFLGKK
ncbi:helix-turn-helix transcriptional regulator [Leptospira bandrabouensis]|uniref:helix-turn-helix domain-containing protein n=1 Tax=Leptospira bandrabouensis TaxID=2484903 RepID=UPI00223D212C|nr:helix-turn-helix transcriptional regulator [Leptospira bandrabouensis]MCW7460182.1 helix-turn-helix transcriptional regulator [Leptospira bandrabouensis]MCW7479301.1 helix-turn-helix transcriptional regulator [Leptospira bandrabouensis]MCW7486982.1 helix-turn-helix transcriptional regulator [Leptospira bandrabouensis]